MAMLEFFQKLFIGHAHKWAERSQHPAVDSNGQTQSIVVVLRCETCGRMKNHKISG